MHKTPSEHEEWLEENSEPEKKSLLPQKKAHKRPSSDKPSGANQRLEALNDDIQEYG